MKAMVAGFVVIALSGAAVLWHRLHEAPRISEELEGERISRCMVWKAQRGKATVWLCGSYHLLRKSDYPLPPPYLTAFDEAERVVMELPPGEPIRQYHEGGRLPEGKTLEDTVSTPVWKALARRRSCRAA